MCASVVWAILARWLGTARTRRCSRPPPGAFAKSSRRLRRRLRNCSCWVSRMLAVAVDPRGALCSGLACDLQNGCVCVGLPSARLQHRTPLTKDAQEADVRSCLRESAKVYNKLLKVHEELLVGHRSGIARDCSGCQPMDIEVRGREHGLACAVV